MTELLSSLPVYVWISIGVVAGVLVTLAAGLIVWCCRRRYGHGKCQELGQLQHNSAGYCYLAKSSRRSNYPIENKKTGAAALPNEPLNISPFYDVTIPEPHIGPSAAADAIRLLREQQLLPSVAENVTRHKRQGSKSKLVIKTRACNVSDDETSAHAIGKITGGTSGVSKESLEVPAVAPTGSSSQNKTEEGASANVCISMSYVEPPQALIESVDSLTYHSDASSGSMSAVTADLIESAETDFSDTAPLMSSSDSSELVEEVDEIIVM